MIKILHAADFHLDSPFRGLPPEKAQAARRAQRELPHRLAELCRERKADLVLLAGDLFDRVQASRDSVDSLMEALSAMAVPVFISPGNHDYFSWDSPYYSMKFPENVHIFSKTSFQSVALPSLSCRVYGAGYTGIDCPGLLASFQREGTEQYHIMVLHGEVTGADSPYCPIIRGQIAGSNLDYLALGHNHARGQVRLGRTLCAWPGCPMGRGFDEEGTKGAYLVTLSETGAEAAFLPLMQREYHILTVPAGLDAAASVLAALPGDASRDIYRVILTGESDELDFPALESVLAPHFYALDLRDRTTPKVDLWQSAADDSLEGHYFKFLQQAAEEATDETIRRRLVLAARLSRKLLDGREVDLP